jgi:pimeloyl-ACP methyl ester carboxylesterase
MLSRRDLFAGACAFAAGGPVANSASAVTVNTDVTLLPPYGNGTLPAGIRPRVLTGINGLNIHFLESGFETPNRPAVLLLHGFPELAFSWRKIMPSLSSAGYHVIAPDQRGFGRTTAWDDSYDADPDPFRMLNMVRDVMALLFALGHRHAAMIAGHDAGSPVAAWAALIRPDIFRSVAIMATPFDGPPSLPFADASGSAPSPIAVSDDKLDTELARLDPPRKYYQNYYRTRGANDDMLHASQGLHNFFRAYYFCKSADFEENKPHPLKARTADELAQIPHYYVMLKDRGMAENVAPLMPSADYISKCRWLTEAELEVYASEYGRTGFTGALQTYRVRRGADLTSLAEMLTFSGRTIDIPSIYIAGKSDWGVYQTPGAVEKMRSAVLTRMAGFHLVEGAGHWVQQEKPDQVSQLLIEFLRGTAAPTDR